MPATEQLATIEKMNLVLGVAAVAGGGLLWGARGMLAAGAGAALSVANFWALRRLGARAVARVEAGATTGQALLLVASLAGKMMLLFALVWVAIRRIGLQDHRKERRRDVRRGGRGVWGVVAGVGATDRDAADGYSFSRARVLVAEAGVMTREQQC